MTVLLSRQHPSTNCHLLNAALSPACASERNHLSGEWLAAEITWLEWKETEGTRRTWRQITGKKALGKHIVATKDASLTNTLSDPRAKLSAQDEELGPAAAAPPAALHREGAAVGSSSSAGCRQHPVPKCPPHSWEGPTKAQRCAAAPAHVAEGAGDGGKAVSPSPLPERRRWGGREGGV